MSQPAPDPKRRRYDAAAASEPSVACRFCAKRVRPGVACCLTDVAHPGEGEIDALFDTAAAWRLPGPGGFSAIMLWMCPKMCRSSCPMAHRHGRSERTPSHLEVLRDRQAAAHEAAAALALSRVDIVHAIRRLESEGPQRRQGAMLGQLWPFERREAEAEEALRAAEAARELADAEWRKSDVTMRALLIVAQAGYGEEARACRGLDRAAHRDEIFWRCDINALRGPPGYEKSLLMTAAKRSDFRMALRLISLGADVGKRDLEGRQALHYAAHNAYGGAEAAKVARVLLGHGAEVNAKDERGRTALSYVAGVAAFPMRPCKCREFCSCGMDFWSTPFEDWHKEDNKDRAKSELAAVLLQHGADPTGISSPRHGQNKYTSVSFWRVESLMRTFEAERARRHAASEYEKRALGPDALAYLGMR